MALEHPDTAIHLAGSSIVAGHRAIQRCIVCGKALVNDDLSKMASPDGNVGPNFFKMGSLVAVTDCGHSEFKSVVGELAEDFKIADLPKDFCLDLVEA